jgi:membrane protease YdiL (CAAX protease family)
MEVRQPYRMGRWRLVAWLAFVLLLAALGYASQAAGSEVPEDVAYQYSSAVAAVVQFAIFVGILLLLTLRLPRREVFALRRPPSWPRALALVAGALVLIFVLGAALTPLLDAGEEQGLVPEEWDPDRLGAYLAFAASVTFVAPVVEELMFRGLGYTLLAPYGEWVAIIGTGVLFGLYHGLLIALPVLTAFGIVIGWVRAKTNSIYPCMVLHATFNGIGIGSVPFVA